MPGCRLGWGSEMTDAQEKCLEPFGMITVALDDDAVGNGKSRPDFGAAS